MLSERRIESRNEARPTEGIDKDKKELTAQDLRSKAVSFIFLVYLLAAGIGSMIIVKLNINHDAERPKAGAQVLNLSDGRKEKNDEQLYNDHCLRAEHDAL